MTLCQELGLLQASIVPSRSSLSFPPPHCLSHGSEQAPRHPSYPEHKGSHCGPVAGPGSSGCGPSRSGGMPLTSTPRDQSWDTLVSS